MRVYVAETYPKGSLYPDANRYYGPEGFTKTPEVRAIIGPWIDKHPEGWDSVDVVRFYLPAPSLVKLADLLPREHGHHRQNDAPSFGQFVAIANLYPSLTFECYRVDGTHRYDERITVEGFVAPDEDTFDAVCDLIAHSMAGSWPPDEHERFALRCWWD